MKVLFTASVMGHLTNFHVPYMQYFKDMGYEVHIACGSGHPPDCVDRHHVITFERSPFKPRNLKCYRQLKKAIDENSYDLIHCHTPVAGVLTRLAARKARQKGTVVLYTAHGFHFFRGASRISGGIFRIIEKWLCRYTDILITINSEDFEALAHYGFKPALGAYKIPGVGVDAARFQVSSADKKRENRRLFNIDPNAFVLIFAAEYNRNKNQMTLLEAVSILKKDIPTILLLLPGRGPMQDEYTRAAASMGIADNVWIMGFRPDMDQLLAAADVAVSSSLREGLGINLVEAMATGLPVAATRIRGHLDLVKEGENGFLVDIRNAEAMANRLMQLSQSPGLRAEMGRKALEMVKPFLLENAKAEMIRIYDQAVQFQKSRSGN